MDLLYVVAAGNAFEGINLTGPFPSYEDAGLWANNNVDSAWDIVPVEGPVADEEEDAPLLVKEGGSQDLQLETLEAIATAALTGPWLDGGVVYEGDGVPGLSVQTGPGLCQGVAFVTDWSDSGSPLPQDFHNQAHILAFQPQTALALINRIKALEKRLNYLGG